MGKRFLGWGEEEGIVITGNPLKNVIVSLAGCGSAEDYAEQLLAFLPSLDIDSHVYVLSDHLPADYHNLKEIMNCVGGFLRQYLFYRLTLHPVHRFDSDPVLRQAYQDLFSFLQTFYKEAYVHQTVSRFMVLPVIRVDNQSDIHEAAPFFDLLRNQSMAPSLFLARGLDVSGLPDLVKTEGERIYFEIGEGSVEENIIYTLSAHWELDTLLRWVSNGGKTSLPPPGTHALLEENGNVSASPRGLSYGKSPLPPSSPLVPDKGDTPAKSKEERLLPLVHTVHDLRETLVINHREKELAALLFHLGLELVKGGHYQEAIGLFNDAVSFSDRVDSQGRLSLARALCHLKLREFSLAGAALEEAKKQNAPLPMVCYYLGLYEFERKDYIEAIDMFAKALEAGVDQIPAGDAHFYMGLSHINILEYEEGLARLHEAEKRYPQEELSPVYYYLGVCHFGKNDLPRAYEFFEKARDSNPKPDDLSSIYLYLGICHKEKGEYAKALAQLSKSKESEEGRLEVHNLMGFCHFKLHDYDKAIESFLRAVELDPYSAIDWANLGVNVRAKGEDEKALLLFRKALSLDPSLPLAKKHVKELMEQKNL